MKTINRNLPLSQFVKKKGILSVGIFLLVSSICSAREVDLVIPTFHPTWKYYRDLVKKSLVANGYQVTYEYLPSDTNQKRIMRMLEEGKGGPLFLWRSRNAKRDRLLVPIRVDIGEQMLGMRVLFIRKGTQPEFDNIKTLDDFRLLGKKGAFGHGWSDIKVWEYNNLPVSVIDGNWDKIYRMLAKGDRNIDYFSRGIFEIFIEHKQHPELDIEENLLFSYEKSLYLYFSKPYAHLQPILESSLKNAQKTGLMKEVMLEYFPEAFEELKRRTIIHVDTP